MIMFSVSWLNKIDILKQNKIHDYQISNIKIYDDKIIKAN